MNLHEAQHLATELMRQHGLRGWLFRFDHARRRFGSCQPTRRTITLSRPLTLLNGIEQVRDTVLHEIAHALTPGENHGPRWREKCREIGALPKRCFTASDGVLSPPRPRARFQIGCVGCNWWADRFRRARSRLICRKCRVPVVYRSPTGQLYTQSGRALVPHGA